MTKVLFRSGDAIWEAYIPEGDDRYFGNRPTVDVIRPGGIRYDDNGGANEIPTQIVNLHFYPGDNIDLLIDLLNQIKEALVEPSPTKLSFNMSDNDEIPY